jgi:hypothetical protein
MAQGITLISGSPLIGSPIVYRVVPAAYNANRTFHRIVVKVYAALETDEDYTTFNFSTLVETKSVNGGFATVASNFDISSALQAVADKYEYEATPPERYPYIKFRIEAWDEWMMEGNTYNNQGIVLWPTPPGMPPYLYYLYAYAHMGAWTDLERMNASVDQGGVEYLNITKLSRKPNTSPELVFKNVAFVYPGAFSRGLETDYIDSESGMPVSNAPSTGPKSLSYTPASLGAVTVGDHDLYVIDKPANSGHVLRFVNGMGCIESLHVQSLIKREASNKTEKHSVAKQETLKQFSRTVTMKKDGPETWSLTSGALDRDWASWYIHEFLMSPQVWIMLNGQSLMVNGQWIPCHVVPEETTVLEDQQKAQPYEVQFKLEMDINGSPL